MSTSHNWQVLLDMDKAGDYSEVVWELADATANGPPVPSGTPVTVRESYSSSLGCNQR